MYPRKRKAVFFGAFEQSDTSVTRRFGGTGLGLVICQRLIQQMGGDIFLESVEGEGSTFTVNLALPVVDDQKTAMPTGDLPVKISVSFSLEINCG